MLGSIFRFGLFFGMAKATSPRQHAGIVGFIAIFLALLFTPAAFSQTNLQLPQKLPAPGGEVTLAADQQRQSGRIFYADGHVDMRYENVRLRADHIEYDEQAQTVSARGNVQLDYLTQHVEADDARYELKTGKGSFHHVRARYGVQRRPQPTLLSSPN